MEKASDPTNWDEFLAQFPHGVLVLKGDQIVHAVGYEHPATQQDADNLVQELKTDTDLALTNLTDYHITPVSGDVWRKYLMIFVGED